MEYTAVTHATAEVSLGRRPAGSELTATVHRYVGGPGPTLYVQAAQHGIELNGVAALRRLHERLADATLAGTVVAVPVANRPAFDHRQYVAPAAYDAVNTNLNRVWPGDAEGTFQERMAARLWDLVSGADAAVDLHTGTADMLEHVRYTRGKDPDRRLAAAFGTDYLLADRDESADEASDAAAEKGTFRAAVARTGTPAVTAELANSRTLSHAAVETGVDGVWNVVRELDMRPEPPAERPDQTTLRDDGQTVTAADSGLFEPRPDVAVGDRVAAGDPLGALYCPSTYERLDRVTAGEGGVVYSLAREAVVVEGERIAALATPA